MKSPGGKALRRGAWACVVAGSLVGAPAEATTVIEPPSCAPFRDTTSNAYKGKLCLWVEHDGNKVSKVALSSTTPSGWAGHVSFGFSIREAGNPEGSDAWGMFGRGSLEAGADRIKPICDHLEVGDMLNVQLPSRGWTTRSTPCYTWPTKGYSLRVGGMYYVEGQSLWFADPAPISLAKA